LPAYTPRWSRICGQGSKVLLAPANLLLRVIEEVVD
jgi:hypothetical protein